MSRVKQFVEVQTEALDLFEKKNTDYGDAFANYGPVGVIVRLGDKISRLQNVRHNKITMVNSESVRDTLIDLHNYAAMAIMLIDEESKKKGERDIIYSNGHYLNGSKEEDLSVAFN